MLFDFKLETPSEGLVDITSEVSEAVKESSACKTGTEPVAYHIIT